MRCRSTVAIATLLVLAAATRPVSAQVAGVPAGQTPPPPAAQTMGRFEFVLDNNNGAYVTMNGLGHYVVSNTVGGYQFPAGKYNVVAYEGGSNRVLHTSTQTLVAGSTHYVKIGIIARSRHGCNPGPGCNQPKIPPMPPWGNIGYVAVENRGSAPVKLLGMYTVDDAWADAASGMGTAAWFQSPVVDTGGKATITLDHLTQKQFGLYGTSHSLVVGPGGLVAIYLGGDFTAPSCASLRWKLVITDSKTRVVTSSYTGPVLDFDDTKTICSIIGCPQGSSTYSGVKYKNATVVTTAAQGHVAWSCA